AAHGQDPAGDGRVAADEAGGAGQHGSGAPGGLDAAVRLSRTGRQGRAARTAASWEVAYEPAGGAVKASVGQGIQSTPAGAAAATRLGRRARLARGAVMQGRPRR